MTALLALTGKTREFHDRSHPGAVSSRLSGMIETMPAHSDSALFSASSAAPFGASSEPMGIMFIIAMVLLAIALVLALLGKWLRLRNTPSPELRRRSLRFVPVPADVQRSVSIHLGEGDHARATMLLRSGCESMVSQLQAEELVALVRTQDHPATFPAAAKALREHEPELAAELDRIREQQSEVAAIRALRVKMPLDLLTAKKLVEHAPEQA